MASRWSDLSVTTAPHEFSMSFATTGGGANGSMFDESLLGRTLVRPVRELHPRADIADRFYEIAQSGVGGPAGALDALARYAEACEDGLEAVDAWERFLPNNARLVEEANTWSLLHCLRVDETAAGAAVLADDAETAPSPKAAVERLFREDRDVRLMQTVVDWLEGCTGRQDRAIPPVGKAGGSLHWENTLHAIQNGGGLFDSARGGGLITELDPDAPRRQKRNLHALDAQDDDALCRRIFKELRCGRFEEAVSLCVDAGQMWRGIILQGWRLLDHPEPPQTDSTLPISGNPSRALWKWACSQYLDLPGENAHFKASLGVLSGKAEAALPVCADSREDLLWAHLRIQIERRVDAHLKERCESPDERLEPESPQELSMHQIFARVKSLYRGDEETPHQEVRRHLVLDQIDALLLRATSWIDGADHDLVRFLSHLVLALRQIGKGSSPEAGNKIVETYVRRLIDSEDGPNASPEQIAFYASKLPRKTQIELFSDYMWTLDIPEDRQAAIDAGVRAGLDVQSATKETVRRAIRMLKDRLLSGPAANVTFGGDEETEQRKLVYRVIGCLEWLSFYKSQIFDAVAMSNAIIRILIFKGDVDAATAVLARLTEFFPISLIAQTMEASSNFLREFFCLKAYLDAINGYASWYRQHVGGRPRSPEPLVANCSFTDKVHYEQIKANIVMQQQKWAAAGLHQANHIKQLLYNVLKFPEGWLVDDISNQTDETNHNLEELLDRQKQLDSLRKLCVPEVVLLLLKVLQSGNIDCHTEAIRLAELLASEKRKLYLLFPKHKLQEVLHKIGESSLNVLENNRDPWGFVTNNDT